MPTSRNRKQKQKKGKMKDHQNKPDEVIERDGMRWERKGDFSSLQNTRTPEEHAQYIASIPELLKQIELEIAAITQDVIAVFSNHNKIQLLGALNYNLLSKQGDSDDDGMAETILEYGLSIAVALPGNPAAKVTGEIVNELIDILKAMRTAYLAKLIHESALKGNTGLAEDKDLNELRFHTIVEAVTIRGSGYYAHVRELFLEMYAGHNTFLEDTFGFNAIDIVETAEALENALYARTSTETGMPHFKIKERFFHWALSNGRQPVMNRQSVADFQRQNPDIILTNGMITTYGVNRVDQYEKLYKIHFINERHEKVVKKLALQFGDNSAFIEAPSNADLLADTKIRERPYTQVGDDYYLLSMPLFSRYLFSMGQYLLENAGDERKYFNTYYRGKAKPVSRDRFMERKVEEVFKRLLPGVNFIPNVEYRIPGQNIHDTELDLLGIGTGCTYLIEVKAGELSVSAKRGAPGSLMTRLKENVGKGDFQTRRAAEFIQNEEKPIFIKDKKEIQVNKANPLFRIVVTFDTFAGLLVSTTVLENNNLVVGGKDYPWIVNILDLMIFADLLESEKDFIGYLTARLALNSWKGFTTNDEINLLAHYFLEGLKFKDEHKELDTFMLQKYLSDIDAYYRAKQEGRIVPKPKRNRT